MKSSVTAAKTRSGRRLLNWNIPTFGALAKDPRQGTLTALGLREWRIEVVADLRSSTLRNVIHELTLAFRCLTGSQNKFGRR